MIGPKVPQREADIILFPPHHTSRPLVTATNVRAIRTTGHPRTTTVDAVIRTPRPKHPTRGTGERIVIGFKILGALLATTAVAALVYLAYLAVMAVIALVTTVVTWVSAHLFLIGAVIIGLLFFGGSTAACAGIHCGGCKG
jgi:hypothetical protein